MPLVFLAFMSFMGAVTAAHWTLSPMAPPQILASQIEASFHPQPLPVLPAPAPKIHKHVTVTRL